MENGLYNIMEQAGIGCNIYIYWLVVIACTIFLFYLSALICRKIITPIIRALTRKTKKNWDDIILNDKAIRSVCNLVPAVALLMLMPMIAEKETSIYTIATRLCWVYITALLVRLACVILSSLYIITNSSERTKNHTLQGVFQMLKIVAICIGAIHASG